MHLFYTKSLFFKMKLNHRVQLWPFPAQIHWWSDLFLKPQKWSVITVAGCVNVIPNIPFRHITRASTSLFLGVDNQSCLHSLTRACYMQHTAPKNVKVESFFNRDSIALGQEPALIHDLFIPDCSKRGIKLSFKNEDVKIWRLII